MSFNYLHSTKWQKCHFLKEIPTLFQCHKNFYFKKQTALHNLLFIQKNNLKQLKQSQTLKIRTFYQHFKI